MHIKEVCSKDYTPEQINAWGGREYNYESKKSLIENHYVWVVEKAGSIEGYGLLFIDKENKSAEEVKSLKAEMLANIYRILAISLGIYYYYSFLNITFKGQPPKTFDWKFRNDIGEYHSIAENITPLHFYEKFIRPEFGKEGFGADSLVY